MGKRHLTYREANGFVLTWELSRINLDGAGTSNDALDGAAASTHAGTSPGHESFLVVQVTCALHASASNALDVLQQLRHWGKMEVKGCKRRKIF